MSPKNVMVRRYGSHGEYERDAAKLSKQGWTVVSVTQEQRNSGCMRGCLLGLLALVFKPKSFFVVTYERT